MAGSARVVEVEHRGHRVDSKAVGVEHLEPEHRAREQKASHLVAPIVEDEAAPVGMNSLPGVGVLVEVCSVEIADAVLVARKVRGHPVKNDPDTELVKASDQKHQVLRRAVTAGRSKESGRLIPPRPVERVLHHRQEFDVREAHLGDIRG